MLWCALQLSQERNSMNAALARAAAAQQAAKIAAGRRASARSARVRAELHDFSRMLADVDQLAAQMHSEAVQAARAVTRAEQDMEASRHRRLQEAMQQVLQLGEEADELGHSLEGLHEGLRHAMNEEQREQRAQAQS